MHPGFRKDAPIRTGTDGNGNSRNSPLIFDTPSCATPLIRYTPRIAAPLSSRAASGGVAEWFKAHAWNACIRETVSRVRIPLPPPFERFVAWFLLASELVEPIFHTTEFIGSYWTCVCPHLRLLQGRERFTRAWGRGTKTFKHIIINSSTALEGRTHLRIS